MNLTYRAAQSFSYAYFRLFHGLKIQGLENIPKVNAFILACNHLSFFDPPAIGCRIPRNLHYFARDSLFHGPMGFLIRKLNSIPVNRKQLDIKTLRIVLKVLASGEPILLFPEGTRSESGSLQKAQSGLGFLAFKSGVPIVPARIIGSDKALGKGMIFPRIGQKISLKIGKMFVPDVFPSEFSNAQKYEEISKLAMSRIENL